MKHTTRLPARILAALLVMAMVALVLPVPTAQAARVAKKPVSKTRTSKKTVSAKKTLPKIVPRRLDGVFAPAAKANLWPIAVMVDNFPAARPQAGLADASVVYEALAEGGIPRFMAVFGTRRSPVIGPVRSARPYFLRYAAEYSAALVHAGGSPDAQTLLRELRLVNIEGVKGKTANHFFRRGGPLNVHGLYTTGAQLAAALKRTSVAKRAPVFSSWKFSNQPALAKRPRGSHGATVNLGAGASYVIRYDYDRKRNVYLRSTGGRPHLDENTKEQLAAKNVVLLLTPKERVLDRKGRLAIRVKGSGKAILLKNGSAATVQWKKSGDRSRTVFTASRKEISLNRGATWMTIVPRGHSWRVW